MNITLQDISRTNVNQIAIAIEILKCYNCRASEVLSAEWSNYYKDSYLLLQGSKNSANIVIRDRFILGLIDKLPRLHDSLIFPSLTYSKLYHHVKKYYSHLFKKFKGRKNYKVTHGWRYSHVQGIKDEKFVREILHHRSVKSGHFYQQKKKG